MRTYPLLLTVLASAALVLRAAGQPAPVVAPATVPPAAAPATEITPAAAPVAAPTPAPAPAAPAVTIKEPEPAKGSATKGKDTSGKETLSVDFPDEDVRNILRNVADLFELNVIIPDTLQGKTTIKLRDVT